MESRDMQGVGIIRRLDDVAELRAALHGVYDEKSHAEVSRFGVLLAAHVLAMTGTAPDAAMLACMEMNEAWQRGEVKFQAARQAAFALHRMAREVGESDPVRVKLLRTLGQIAAIPHVKRHGLVAADYAVKLVSVMRPGDMEAVRAERMAQIEMMRQA